MAARPVAEMTETHAPHRQDDLVDISALVAGDVEGRRPAQPAANRLGACAGCGMIAADLQVIVTSLRRLPPVHRAREFRLDAGTAARLRPPLWRRIARGLAGRGLTVANPVGGVLTALGLAGLLLMTVPAVSPGPAAGTPVTVVPAEPGAAGTAGTAEATARGAHEGVGAADGAPAAGPREDGAPDGTVEVSRGVAGRGAGASSRAPTPSLVPQARGVDAAPRPGNATLAVLSGSFLIAGLGLLGIRWTGRRLGG